MNAKKQETFENSIEETLLWFEFEDLIKAMYAIDPNRWGITKKADSKKHAEQLLREHFKELAESAWKEARKHKNKNDSTEIGGMGLKVRVYKNGYIETTGYVSSWDTDYE